MLWRTTEQLIEYRNNVLISGYYSRLDYVSFICQEIGFNIDKCKLKFIKLVYYKNCISNHLLNLSCTIADGGALGAILWLFEFRELIIEECEEKLGARLHINISFLQYTYNNIIIYLWKTF